MSQNKTVFPGLGQEGDFQPQQPYASSENVRPVNNHGAVKGTVFPGMNTHSAARNEHPQTAQPAKVKKNIGKPIVGFLYSISRTGIGEFWPLHIGQNTIGNAPDCDIILGEGTVSQRHANLHINKMKKPEKVEATIMDLGSTNGTLVNENSVSVSRPVECVNGDIITIGENYDLLLLLIDAKSLGLHLSEQFIDVRSEQQEEEEYTVTFSTAGSEKTTVNQQDFPPRFDPASSMAEPMGYPMYEGTEPTKGTVGLDDSGSFKSGGTVV